MFPWSARFDFAISELVSEGTIVFGNTTLRKLFRIHSRVALRAAVGKRRSVKSKLGVELLESRLVPTSMMGDFNNDGYDDLAIGVPYEDIGSVADAGAVNVLYGTASGLSSSLNQILYQGNGGLSDFAELGDHFGEAVAVGDFNGDGYDDLAVGVPFEDIGSINDAGAIHVLYGSSAGLTSSGNRLWHQNSTGISDDSETGDRFGQALAAGKFNGDIFADLAVGVPMEDIGARVDAGAVHVLYGTSSGLNTGSNRVWHQDSTGIKDDAENGDRFGWSLASGDFNNNAFDDLAVGVPMEDLGAIDVIDDAGAVNVLYGSSTGLAAAGDHFLQQGASGVGDLPELGDRFGFSLVAADFDGGGRADLAVGVPFENIGSIWDAGQVSIIYGSSSGLTGSKTFIINPASIATGEQTEYRDRFGFALSAGDFDGSGRADLAIGVPNEDVGAADDAGAVTVLYDPDPFVTSRRELWHQDTSGIIGVSEQRDHFGSGLTTGDFNSDGRFDLAVGIPYDEVGAIYNAGAVIAIYGATGGLTSSGDQWWNQSSTGIQGGAEYGDRFGSFGGGTPISEFQIDFVFPDSSLLPREQQILFEAAERWSEVILGDLPSYTTAGGIVVDDLRITVIATNIGGGTANSRPLEKRPGSFLPATGEIKFEVAQLPSLTENNLFVVTMHEIGHVLGIGTIWGDLGLANTLQYFGPYARNQYNLIFGNTSSYIPLDPVSHGHWDETIFGNELMTPTTGSVAPLSRITVGALKDMGYQIDFDGADYFMAPP